MDPGPAHGDRILLRRVEQDHVYAAEKFFHSTLKDEYHKNIESDRKSYEKKVRQLQKSPIFPIKNTGAVMIKVEQGSLGQVVKVVLEEEVRL
jgi:hypothetical protein